MFASRKDISPTRRQIAHDLIHFRSRHHGTYRFYYDLAEKQGTLQADFHCGPERRKWLKRHPQAKLSTNEEIKVRNLFLLHPDYAAMERQNDSPGFRFPPPDIDTNNGPANVVSTFNINPNELPTFPEANELFIEAPAESVTHSAVDNKEASIDAPAKADTSSVADKKEGSIDTPTESHPVPLPQSDTNVTPPVSVLAATVKGELHSSIVKGELYSSIVCSYHYRAGNLT